MQRSTRFTLFSGVACAALAVVAVVMWEPGPPFTVVPIAAWYGLWFVLGRPCSELSVRAWIVVLAGAGLSGLLTAMNPNLAVSQIVTLPAVWLVLGDEIVFPIIGCVLVTAVTLVGFVVVLGPRDGIPSGLFSETFSLVGAVGFGLWISFFARQSEARGRLIAELEAAQAELATMHRDAGVIQERGRIAREIHDTIAQSLTGIVLLSQRARRELTTGRESAATPDAAAAVSDTLTLIESAASEALAEARGLLAANTPVELGAGLADALVRLGERFERESGIRVEVQAEQVAGLDRDGQVVLLRCAQEALANARKHSGASAAIVRVRQLVGAVALEVRDNGRGFDASLPGGFGLSGMRDRLAAIGGRLETHGEVGSAGVTAILPLGPVAGPSAESAAGAPGGKHLGDSAGTAVGGVA